MLAARTGAEIDELAEEIGGSGREALPVRTDVTSKSDVDAMVQQTLERFGRVDILVNNAGFADHKAIPDISEADWDVHINVNLKAVFLCTQAVFTHLCAQGSGHIVNVSSLAGKYHPYKMAAYGSAKWGVAGLTGITQEEGRPHGVRAVLIRPGNVDTQMQHDNHDVYPEKLMQPEDIAEAIVHAVTQHRVPTLPSSTSTRSRTCTSRTPGKRSGAAAARNRSARSTACRARGDGHAV